MIPSSMSTPLMSIMNTDKRQSARWLFWGGLLLILLYWSLMVALSFLLSREDASHGRIRKARVEEESGIGNGPGSGAGSGSGDGASLQNGTGNSNEPDANGDGAADKDDAGTDTGTQDKGKIGDGKEPETPPAVEFSRRMRSISRP